MFDGLDSLKTVEHDFAVRSWFQVASRLISLIRLPRHFVEKFQRWPILFTVETHKPSHWGTAHEFLRQLGHSVNSSIISYAEHLRNFSVFCNLPVLTACTQSFRLKNRILHPICNNSTFNLFWISTAQTAKFRHFRFYLTQLCKTSSAPAPSLSTHHSFRARVHVWRNRERACSSCGQVTGSCPGYYFWFDEYQISDFLSG